MAVREIVVSWLDDETAYAAAKRAGMSDGESLSDYIEIEGFRLYREFATMKAAKSWAIRNRKRDIFSNPDLDVFEYPNERKFSWDRERVLSMRYIGDGFGWEELEIA